MKAVLFAFVAILCLNSCREKDTNFRVKGELTGFKGSVVYIYSNHDNRQKIDTVSVDNGKFIYEQIIDTVVPMTLLLKDGAEEIAIFANKGYEVSLTGDASKPFLLKVEGGELNGEMNRLRAELADKKTQKQIQATVEKYIRTHPKSELNTFLIETYFIRKGDDLGHLLKMIQGLNGKQKDEYAMQQILKQGEQLKTCDIDFNAPNFSFPRKNEPAVTLTGFGGKLLLIQFWASWNPKSVEYMKAAKDLETRYEGKLNILNVSLDVNEGSWKSAVGYEPDSIARRKQVCDFDGWESKMAQAYGISRIPANILINNKQKIVGKDLFGNELTNRLNALTASQK